MLQKSLFCNNFCQYCRSLILKYVRNSRVEGNINYGTCTSVVILLHRCVTDPFVSWHSLNVLYWQESTTQKFNLRKWSCVFIYYGNLPIDSIFLFYERPLLEIEDSSCRPSCRLVDPPNASAIPISKNSLDAFISFSGVPCSNGLRGLLYSWSSELKRDKRRRKIQILKDLYIRWWKQRFYDPIVMK